MSSILYVSILTLRPRLLTLSKNALRSCGCYATSWTLLSIAVRISSALGLGSEGPRSFSVLELETRRRLWYCVSLMDTQATLDRGSALLIPAKVLGPPPLCIDDDDMLNTSNVSGYTPLGFKDMTFCSMTFEAMVCQKQICDVTSEEMLSLEHRWRRKLDLASALRDSFENKYFTIPDNSPPLQILTRESAKMISSSMQLLLRKPPYRQSHDAIPPWDDFDLLAVSTEVLEGQQRKTSEFFRQFAWKRWPPWYALAVVLAELCRRKKGPMWDRAYMAAKATFKLFATVRQILE